MPASCGCTCTCEAACAKLHVQLHAAETAVARHRLEGGAIHRHEHAAHHVDVVRNRHHRALGALKHKLQREREQQHA
jgi:hypothetical protein